MTATPAVDSALLAQLKAWEGRQEVLADTITAAPVLALSATLDRDDAVPAIGTELPPLWHWLYFLPHHRQSELGPDGHARRGGFLPPVPLPRRMWAGGRIQWVAPLRVGDEVTRTSTIQSVTHKTGRTGDLVFVLVEHKISNRHGIALVEEHDIVYRGLDAAVKSPAAAAAEKVAQWRREITPDDVLLFRYSALTFNGHRIHYDRRYVTQEEGYPGLVVHGPLIATLLLDLVRRERPGARLDSFSFKAQRPVFDLNPFHVNGAEAGEGELSLWASDHENALVMQAQAHYKST